MNLTLTIIEWASMLTAAWLGYRAYNLEHTRAKTARACALASFAVIALILIPAVYAVWTIIGEYPMFTCPNCTSMTGVTIWTTIIITLVLAISPFALALYVLSLKRN
ncbi:hypothetical protein ALP15_01892 [Pseudomonas savastanoi]|uniref:Uncharacterized protein n=1 Tax=Pseudomonas savastanoi TaxID=29438 RepID=A0A3M6ANK0_PSESS|nr:hypothetical protein ALP15_01892 [Pseudomonas savastanoi]